MIDVQLKDEDSVVIAMMDGSSHTSDNVPQPYRITG